MKKKWVIGMLTGAVLLGGAGTIAYAEGNGNGLLNFGQMKPYMEKMHPDFSEKQLKDMYNACHGEGGMMENVDPADMMPNGATPTMNLNNL